ncbi:MAG: helicase [Candidatus Liberibacter europaeus]|uniref:Helicase n=1 Tax=Candidatus Liberibacter europaeus TaxID=744859 RepID=A0A2T4VWJ0_9HYPH|nr:helicase [Candidatus Liberibacter europaeus]PTL86145.1 MAG: helicase [Candidatus Liberibacter europaeus]
MLLRDRQKELVEKACTALISHGDTLAVAPTGAGKTIMFSAVLGRLIGQGHIRKACVVAHRDELTEQNETKFKMVNPNITTSRFNSTVKNWNGQVCFAMVQTLNNHCMSMPKIDALVIDEAHHATANSYKNIFNHVREKNTDCKILGMTATPNRGDGNALNTIFSNIADQITVKELISSGHLVHPVCFIMDVGIKNELDKVRQSGADFDMNHVEKIMNTRPINDAVIEHWKEKAGDRKTVVFCSKLEHATDVTQAFKEAGISADMVSGNMGSAQRQEVLSDFEHNKIQVIVNVAVLTEGWDYPPVSCVVLLRPCSQKSILTQMIGRGLRIVDPETYPNVIKKDCVILDFGASLIKHGFVDQKANLDGRKKKLFIAEEETEETEEIEDEEKEEDEKSIIVKFGMKEFEIFKASPFEWVDLGNDILTATGFEAWSCVTRRNGNWHAIGGIKKSSIVRCLMIGERANCLARANDWLNSREMYDSAHKTKSWIKAPATERQLLKLPPQYRTDYSLTKYKASALITMYQHANQVKKILGIH